MSGDTWSPPECFRVGRRQQTMERRKEGELGRKRVGREERKGKEVS